MALALGARVGSYEVLAPLGAGGMGEVYRARDTQLKRDVALKVLPGALTTDPDRLARFRREAEVLAALNHPHIAQIHGLERSDGVQALVMELVDGEDLSQRLSRGAVPVDEALPIARQIAEALEAAHEAGIVHRDLKPANIKVRDDGTVKVLDFGLAKALETGTGNREPGVGKARVDSPTITSPAALTMGGMILGTAAYMAPEQAKGRPVDRRADIWAFGCLLYEMLTGRRAFPGEDVGETLAAVIRGEPDWTALPADLSPALQMYLARCLEKDPRQRLRDIGDMRLALAGAFDSAAAGLSGHVAAPPRRWWQRPIARLALAGVALFVGFLAGAFSIRSAPVASDVRILSVSIPPVISWTCRPPSVAAPSPCRPPATPSSTWPRETASGSSSIARSIGPTRRRSRGPRAPSGRSTRLRATASRISPAVN